MGKIETNLSAAEVGHPSVAPSVAACRAATATSTTRRPRAHARSRWRRIRGRRRRSGSQRGLSGGPTHRRSAGRGSSSSFELMNQHKAALAAAITAEHGKVRPTPRAVSRAIDVVEFACGIHQLLKGDYTEKVHRHRQLGCGSHFGVVAGITPFNFPCMVPAWMFPVAIACGNSFILKPSPTDPRLH